MSRSHAESGSVSGLGKIKHTPGILSFPRKRGSRSARMDRVTAFAGIARCTHCLALAFLLALLFSPAAMSTEIMPPPDSPLIEAVKKGDVNEVKLILAEKQARDEINEKGVTGHTPLGIAARNGNLDIVALLVDNGAAVDGKKGSEDRTPLMEASAYGHVEVVRHLVAKGADVNVRRKGLTPLLTACDHYSVHFGPVGDKEKTVYLLLESGADVNVQDESWLKSGMTPLMFAVTRGDAAMVQAMLARGAKPDAKNSKGDTALSLAKKQGLEYIAGLLEKTASGTGRPAQGAQASKPLIEAIKQGSLGTVKALVSEGADVNARTASGSTPIMYAADGNKAEIAKYLIAKGADVNARSGTNDTALIHASAKGSLKAAKALLQAKADPNIRNMSGGDPLIYAVMNKREDMVRLLLDSGAKVDGRYDQEQTALMMAIVEGSYRIAGLLLDKGADPNALDGDQTTALMYACEKGDAGMVKDLIAKGARVGAKGKYGDTPLEKAISNRHEAVVKILIDKGADFKSTGALTSAVITGSVDLVKLLKDRGADINEKGSDNRTPLMYAAAGEPDMIRYLVSRGADVKAWDKEGKTALMYAVESFGKSKLQAVNLLLENRADCNAVSDKGETALIIAAKRGDAGIVKALLEKGSAVSVQDGTGKTAWSYAFQGAHTEILSLLEQKGSPRAYDGVTWEAHVSGQEKEFIKVVKDRDEWNGLWKRALDKQAPAVDFGRYAVACVFLGHSAAWLYDIEFGTPEVRGSSLVIPYELLDVELRLGGPFRAGGQYRMTIFEKRGGLDMILEDKSDHRKLGQ